MLIDGALGAAAEAIASYGNTAGINASGKRLLKNGITGITKKAWKYYATQAHQKGGFFVITQLGKSLAVNAVGAGFGVAKDKICCAY